MKSYLCVTNCSQYKRLICIVLDDKFLFVDGQIYCFEIIPIINDLGIQNNKMLHLYHHDDVKPYLIVIEEFEI